jgi:putative hemolysin
MNSENLVFTFATSEVGFFGQKFIKLIELFTGKLRLKKIYEEYISESNPPQNFWNDAVKKLKLNIIPHYHTLDRIPKHGSIIIVANHAFGVVDGVSICSIVSKIRSDYKMITHKVLRQADAVKEKILPIDFSSNKKAILDNIKSRKNAEDHLKNNGLIIIFPSGTIATKSNLKKLTKADDGDWKQFTSKLAMRTNSSILPIFFEGENSYFFHVANKIGQTFRYSLMMYELKRKIGDTVNLHIGNIINNKELKEIGDLKEITKFIRKKTYELDPVNSSV